MFASSTSIQHPEIVTGLFDDDPRDDLLNHIEERKVIPVIGSELLVVETEAGPRNLHAWLAPLLAARCGIPLEELPPEATLNEPAQAASFGLAADPRRFLPPAREKPARAGFISYTRDDLPAVQRLKAAFDAAGIATWYDLDRREGGDDFDRKIQRNIARCSFFIPVISAATQRHVEGYFRREWSWAVDRTRGMAEGAAYILPVCVDATPKAEALVPAKFLQNHLTRLPGAEPTPDFLRRLRELLG